LRRQRRAAQDDGAILATLGGFGAIYCPADYSDGEEHRSRREQRADQAHEGKNNADSIEESGDERISDRRRAWIFASVANHSDHRAAFSPFANDLDLLNAKLPAAASVVPRESPESR
jgi:hypothetical protein